MSDKNAPKTLYLLIKKHLRRELEADKAFGEKAWSWTKLLVKKVGKQFFVEREV